MDIEKLFELLLNDNPSELLKENEEYLFNLVPELKICKGFNQNNEWHIYDVYEHILHVIDNVPAVIELRLAALFHDIGKPISYKEDELGVGHFYGHWEESQKIFNEFANKYNIDEKLKDIVSNLIYYHDLNPLKLDDDNLAIMYEKLGSNGIELLYEFKKADLLAQNKKYHYILDDYLKQKDKVLLRIMK